MEKACSIYFAVGLALVKLALGQHANAREAPAGVPHRDAGRRAADVVPAADGAALPGLRTRALAPHTTV